MDNDLIRRCILDFYDVGIPEHVTRDVCSRNEEYGHDHCWWS
jgi:hypothetical protein